MLLKRILATLATLALTLATGLAFALPTVDQVQVEVQRGHYEQAASMMQEVVQARPDSARAHYVYAEILAHQGRFAEASDQARLARQTDPGIRFAERDKFEAFERTLERERAAQSQPRTTPPHERAPLPATGMRESRGSGLPAWLWGLGGLIIALLLWRLIAQRPRPLAPSSMAGTSTTGAPGAGVPAAGYGPAGYGYGPGYPARPGSGMLGTGVAAAGGFAAGMLADRLLHDHDGNGAAPVHDGSAGSGGLVPGMFDEPGNDANAYADELRERPVDFGAGTDWGGGASDDSGGGSSDDGW